MTAQQAKSLYNNNNGFTLIELLLVVLLIAVMSGSTVALINVSRQRQAVEDAVSIADMEKVVQGLIAFQGAEGSEPVDTNGDGNPLEPSSENPTLGNYLTKWPTGFTYAKGASALPNGGYPVCVSVPMKVDATMYIKFAIPDADGAYTSCIGKVVQKCPAAASCTGAGAFYATGCYDENNTICP